MQLLNLKVHVHSYVPTHTHIIIHVTPNYSVGLTKAVEKVKIQNQTAQEKQTLNNNTSNYYEKGKQS